MMLKPANYILISIIALLGLTACSNDKPLPGEIALNGKFQAEFDLIDQYGEPAADERFEGKPMLMYYGFTTCPEICPAALRIMDQTRDSMGRDAQKVYFVFITVDPERDDQQRMNDHLNSMEGMFGLTGDPAAIRASITAMNVYAERRELPESALGYTMDHSRLFYVIDETGKPVVAIPDSTPPDMVEKILRRYL